jgi:hypothetical protein|tara:strand:- start:3390 stop:3614 length:225 start_codon:yes stop_codon:yes gene_type:complete
MEAEAEVKVDVNVERVTILVEHEGRSFNLSSRVSGTDPTLTEWPFWLGNEGGEGMSLSEKMLFDILDQHFKENF